MKTINAKYGLDTIVARECRNRSKWYHWYRFPVMPIFSFSPADEYNEPNFNFSWLNLRIWSMMSPDIGVKITIEDIGGYLQLRVPYLNIILWFAWFPESWHQKIWRTK